VPAVSAAIPGQGRHAVTFRWRMTITPHMRDGLALAHHDIRIARARPCERDHPHPHDIAR
jgi:hypothetical protein